MNMSGCLHENDAMRLASSDTKSGFPAAGRTAAAQLDGLRDRRSVILRRLASPLRALRTWATWIGSALLLAGPAAAAVDGYTLGPQDKVRITVVEWFTGTGELRSPVNGEYSVGPAGALSLPLIGDVSALGMQVSALADEISTKLQSKLSLSERPTTSVEVVQFRPFFVMGDLERPGEYAFRPGITVLQAVSLAGGYVRVAAPALAQADQGAAQAAGELRNAAARLLHLTVRRARLGAELREAKTIEYPPDLSARSHEAPVAAAMRLEETLFEARRRAFLAALEAQKRLVALYERESLTVQAQAESLRRNEEATQRQGESLRSLQARGLATMGREFDIDRLLADVTVRRQELDAKAIRLQQERVKADAAMQEAEARRRQEVAADLQALQGLMDDLDQRLVVADRALAGAERVGQPGEPAFKIVRQRPEVGQQSEIAASAFTPLQPGDILVVERARPKSSISVGSSRDARQGEGSLPVDPVATALAPSRSP
jgi:polysaccharide biosynthesis/export protein ExoF